jgi:hypothetical protein
MTPLSIGLAVALVLVIAGVLIYAKLILPGRRRRPVVEALGLLQSEDADALVRAEALLVDGVTAGLRKRDLADARFALAYVRARLEKYQEAATSVAELRASGTDDADTVYLQLWLESKLDNHDKVREIYEQHAGTLGDLLQTRLIASISYLHDARKHWGRKEIDGALYCFDRIRELGQLQDRIPGHVDDLQIVNGIQAVFDNRMDDARQAFAGARARAAERGESTAEADLALAACDWRSETMPDVDEDLEQVLAALDDQGRGAPPDDEGRLLRANAALLHAISLLYVWLTRLPAQGGLPPESREQLRVRLSRVWEHDPELGDAVLIGALMDYYFAETDEARRAAIDALEEGTRMSKGILLPELLDLIARERDLQELEKDALGRYLALLKGYLADDGVPVKLRDELRRRLEELSPHREIGEVDLAAYEHAAAPTIEDVRYRGDLLHRRVGAIVQPRLRQGGDDAAQLRDLLEQLQGVTKELVSGVAELEQAEQAVMLRTGEFLLREDTENGGGEHVD